MKQDQQKLIKLSKNSFKKTAEELDILESSEDKVVYALDETGVGVESENYRCWSEVGVPPILEKNGSHEKVNLIGSTTILNEYHTVIDVYENQTINSDKIINHLSYLIELNPNKHVVVYMDNATTHTSKKTQAFCEENKDALTIIYLPSVL